MPRFKAVLAVPNFRWSGGDANTLWHYLPYGLCLLAARARDLCEVEIVDAYVDDMTPEAFQAEIARRRPDLVGVTVLMDQYASSGHLAARLAKQADAGIRVVFGGVYATTNPGKVMEDSNVDFVVVGEGEEVFPRLVEHLMGAGPLPDKGLGLRSGGRVVFNGRADFIADLDSLPLPAYPLIDFQRYANGAHRKSVDSPRAYPYARIVTSRGCPVGCSFCQVESVMGKAFRARSARSVLDEIEFLKERYGVRSLIFDDDNLFMDKRRAGDIFRGMIERGLAMPWVSIAAAVFRLDEDLLGWMRKSGCEYIDVAIESGSRRVLKEVIGKPVDFDYARRMIAAARREGIFVAANFIIGFPTETWDEIRQTVRFAEESGVDYMKLFVLVPLKNTRLWDLCEREGAFRSGYSEEGKKWSAGQLETPCFKADDLTLLRAYEWDRVNFTDPGKRRRTAAMMGMDEGELLAVRRRTLADALRAVKNPG